MKKLRRKFPANFSDLLFIGIFAICVKFALGLVSAVFRIKYNRGRNG